MGGARHLARIAPQPLVRRMFLTGEALRAEDMAAAGACMVLSDREHLLATAERHARRTASFSPTAVRLGKRILARIETMDVPTGYEFEQQFTVRMSGHPDSKEALAAFKEKRDPDYAPLDPGYLIGS
jgi:enoyl-CoA hydratase/carnithine racemase